MFHYCLSSELSLSGKRPRTRPTLSHTVRSLSRLSSNSCRPLSLQREEHTPAGGNRHRALKYIFKKLGWLLTLKMLLRPRRRQLQTVFKSSGGVGGRLRRFGPNRGKWVQFPPNPVCACACVHVCVCVHVSVRVCAQPGVFLTGLSLWHQPPEDKHTKLCPRESTT